MQIVKFLVFLAYATAVFFLPNGWPVMVAVLINLILMALIALKPNNQPKGNFKHDRNSKPKLKNAQVVIKILRQTVRVLPFVLFTAIFNWWLDSWQAALWIGLKLTIVCNATMIYSASMTIPEVAQVIAQICAPLKFIGVSQDEIRILVAISLMMLPIFKKEFREVRQSCRAKGLDWNLGTLKMVLQKAGWALLGRVNQIEEGLMAKGYQIDD